MKIASNDSYESAWLVLKGFSCDISRDHNGTKHYSFCDTRSLRQARRQYAEDCDLQEFVEAHRRLKFEARVVLKGKPCSRGRNDSRDQ